MITTKRLSAIASTAGTAAALVAVALTGTPQSAVAGAATNRSATASSGNWAGAVTASSHRGTFQGVAGNWRVPRVTGPGYSSTWVGVDGTSGSHLIQTGTEEEFYGGRAHYFAWYEILPQQPTLRVIHYTSGARVPVRPGDRIFAYVQQSGHGIWTIHLQDKTQGWKYHQRFYYKTPEVSAEWIQEAPTVNGQQSHPADFGSVTFTNLQIKQNGRWHYTQIGNGTRVNQVLGGQVVAAAGPVSQGKYQTITVRYTG